MPFIDPAPASTICRLFPLPKPHGFSLHVGITLFHNKKLPAGKVYRNFGFTDYIPAKSLVAKAIVPVNDEVQAAHSVIRVPALLQWFGLWSD